MNRKDCQESQSSRSELEPEDVYINLRSMALGLSAEKAGIQSSKEISRVWGVLMEMGFPGAVVSLLSLADGTTSLYFSTGGGIIGGGGHAEVVRATWAFVQEAEACLEQASLATDYPLPGEGRDRLYFLTFSGIYTVECDEAAL